MSWHSCLPLCVPGAHEVSFPLQVKKIVEEPVLKSLDAVVASVMEVRTPCEGITPRSPAGHTCVGGVGRVCSGWGGATGVRERLALRLLRTFQ